MPRIRQWASSITAAAAMSTAVAFAIVCAPSRAEESGASAAVERPTVLPVRAWLDLIATRAGVLPIVAPGVPADRLDAPLLGSIAGDVDAHTLEALAFAGNLSLTFDGDVVFVDAAPGGTGIWRMVGGAISAPQAVRPDALVKSAVALSDATVSYALGSCAASLEAAVFVTPAVYDAQPLVRLTGDEQTRVKLLGALASQCEATAVGFGGAAFVLMPALPDSGGFERVDAHVWMRQSTNADATTGARRPISIEVDAGRVGTQAARLAESIGAKVHWVEPAPVRDRPSAAFTAEGSFSDVADVWCGLRGLSWRLDSSPDGVAWILQNAAGWSANAGD